MASGPHWPRYLHPMAACAGSGRVGKNTKRRMNSQNRGLRRRIDENSVVCSRQWSQRGQAREREETQRLPHRKLHCATDLTEVRNRIGSAILVWFGTQYPQWLLVPGLTHRQLLSADHWGSKAAQGPNGGHTNMNHTRPDNCLSRSGVKEDAT